MSTGEIGKDNVGRIAERIVANELEYRGFTVRDLNLERIAANVDLLAVKGGNAWQIQVKGSSYETKYPSNGWWFQYGYCEVEHIQNSSAKMFNRRPGSFKATIIALVCVRSPHEYQFVMLPIDRAEEAAQINLDYGVRTKKSNGEVKKPGKAYFDFYSVKARTQARQEGIRREQDLLRPFLIDRSRNVDTDKREQVEAYISQVFDKVFAAGEATPLTPSLRG